MDEVIERHLNSRSVFVCIHEFVVPNLRHGRLVNRPLNFEDQLIVTVLLLDVADLNFQRLHLRLPVTALTSITRRQRQVLLYGVGAAAW